MLVIVEKPAVARWVQAQLSALYPGQPLHFLFANQFGWPFVYDYPSKLHWHDYPLWLEAKYRLNAQHQWQALPTEEGTYSRTFADYAALKPQPLLAVLDPGHSGVLAAHRLIDHLRALGKVTDWHGVRTCYSLADDEAIAKSLATRLDDATVQELCQQAQVKADFEYSFLVNSAGLLTRCYQAAGGEVPNPVFSKYTIQTLYALRRSGPLTADQLIGEMHRWPGTGKYRNPLVSLGSAASRSELVDNLQRLGLTTGSWQGRGRIWLTPLAEAFLERLHPDCEDADLPFRLEAWLTDAETGRVAAQRYIRTWFGKQKRFMDR